MRDGETIKNDIINHLAQVIDPELNVDVVNLGLIYGIDFGRRWHLLNQHDFDHSSLYP